MDISTFFNYWMLIMYGLFALGLVMVLFYEYSNFKRKH
jgi:hypothetical protein